MEIERKWLVKPEKIPYNLKELEREKIQQAYISFSPVIRVRSINDDNTCLLTIKTAPPAGSGQFSREEHEFRISAEDYHKLLVQCKGRLIEKTRYIHPICDDLKEEIDIFSGELLGLAYMEIEFTDEHSAKNYTPPDWVERDVSNEAGFSNADLAQSTDLPFRT